MALTLATELANYAAGIGTQGATLKVDSANKRVGVGTTNPQGPEGSLQVGTGITFFGNTGIISAIGGKFSGDFTVGGTLTYEDVQNVNSSGVGTFSGGINIVGGGLTVTGVSTFFSRVSIADSIVHTGDIDTSLRFPAADTFTVETGGDERIRFTSGPTIGIGDNNPNSGETLVVARSGSTPTIRVNGASSYEAQLKLQADGTATDTQLIAAKTDGSLAFSRWTGSAYTERVRITSGGDVGIGTTNPVLGRLQVERDIGIYRASSDPTLNFAVGGTSGSPTKTYRILIDDDDSDKFQVRDSNTARITLDGSGKVGINSTSPGNRLSVDGDIGIYGSGTNHRNLYIYKNNVATAWFKYRGDNNVVVIGNNAGDRLTINPNGGLNVAGITTATQLFEGTTRVATTGKAIAMAMLFG